MRKDYHITFFKYWNKNGWTGHACAIIRNSDGASARFKINSDSNIRTMFYKKFNQWGNVAYSESWLQNREFHNLTKNYNYVNDCDITEFWNQLKEEFKNNPDCYSEE